MVFAVQSIAKNEVDESAAGFSLPNVKSTDGSLVRALFENEGQAIVQSLENYAAKGALNSRCNTFLQQILL